MLRLVTAIYGKKKTSGNLDVHKPVIKARNNNDLMALYVGQPQPQ